MTPSETRTKSIFPSLSESQFRRMHEASLERLERSGVRLYLEEAVDPLKKAGAEVMDGNLVRVPRRLVEKALSSVPRQVTLYDRKGNPAMPVGGYRSFYGPAAARYQMEAMLSATTKPIIYVTYETSGCRDAVEMAEAVMGGGEALRRTPRVACYINAVSGLRHNKAALEKLLFLASENLP